MREERREQVAGMAKAREIEVEIETKCRWHL